jgi:hypothetical protein
LRGRFAREYELSNEQEEQKSAAPGLSKRVQRAIHGRTGDNASDPGQENKTLLEQNPNSNVLPAGPGPHDRF